MGQRIYISISQIYIRGYKSHPFTPLSFERYLNISLEKVTPVVSLYAGLTVYINSRVPSLFWLSPDF